MNVASVRDVEKQLADETVENFSVLRFRPNIISMKRHLVTLMSLAWH